MCGIFGAIDAPDTTDWSAALDALDARGPDGRGLWRSPDRRVHLGHTRLAIVAPDDGHQPLVHGALAVVVNGEFYDHARIRRDLQGEGARFHTGSDSEILVHLYLRHGLDALRHLCGEFAFLIWDGARDRVIAARDRFGVKPLVWMRHQGALLFASKIKGLSAMGAPIRWDIESLAHSCHHQYMPPDRTIVHGVHQIEPGHLMICPLDGTAPRTHCYWRIPHDDPAHAPVGDGAGQAPSPEAWIAHLGARLPRAVTDRLCADVPITTTLSGGLDSAIVTAIAAREGVVHESFGVGFPDTPDYDEAHHAQSLASALGITHHVVAPTHAELIDALPDALRHAEGLCINAHLPAKYLLARAVREAGYKVLLSGEGADELFAGYPHLVQDWIASGQGADRALDATTRGVMVAEDNQMAWPTASARDLLPEGYVPSFVDAKAQLGWRIAALLAPRWRSHIASRDYTARFVRSLMRLEPAPPRAIHPVDRSATLWARSSLANYILTTLGDGTEMAHGVEGRVPFLDHHLWEACASMPPSLKLREGTEKWVLRQVAAPLLPAEIARRPKHPFLAPPLLASPTPRALDFLTDVVRSPEARELPWWDWEGVMSMIQSIPSLSPVERQRVEPVLMTIVSTVLLQQQLGLCFDPSLDEVIP